MGQVKVIHEPRFVGVFEDIADGLQVAKEGPVGGKYPFGLCGGA